MMRDEEGERVRARNATAIEYIFIFTQNKIRKMKIIKKRNIRKMRK
jgi:hypothetical protein